MFLFKRFSNAYGDLVLYLGFKYFDKSRLSSTRAKVESCSDGLRYPKPKTGGLEIYCVEICLRQVEQEFFFIFYPLKSKLFFCNYGLSNSIITSQKIYKLIINKH